MKTKIIIILLFLISLAAAYESTMYVTARWLQWYPDRIDVVVRDPNGVEVQRDIIHIEVDPNMFTLGTMCVDVPLADEYVATIYVHVDRVNMQTNAEAAKK